jgi:hypothetical protein
MLMLGLAASKATKSAKERMSSSFEKSVRGATKIKVCSFLHEIIFKVLSCILTFYTQAAPPKSKYDITSPDHENRTDRSTLV